MGRKFDIYVGDVMGVPRIAVANKTKPQTIDFKDKEAIHKAMTNSEKMSKQLMDIMEDKIVPTFKALLDERGIKYSRDDFTYTQWCEITPHSEVRWGDPEETMLLVSFECTNNNLLATLFGEEHKPPMLFMNAKQWY